MLTLYVHIPFCKVRCPYCDFYLVTRQDSITSFFRALSLETASRASDLKGMAVNAIHFGGGTPSLVPTRFLALWLEEIASLCNFAPDIEIALEANPEDLGGKVMDEMLSVGINRLSIGVQSFSEQKLRLLGRRHTPLESSRVIYDALQRFDSVSIDLICGVPGETLSVWYNDLHKALELRPHHLSVYMLSVEPKTMLYRKISHGQLSAPEDAVQASLYEQAQLDAVQQGYVHYEISNFCLRGYHSRYNLATWQRMPYLGFGPSAHSFLVHGESEIRTANVSSLTKYLCAPEQAMVFREELSHEQQFSEKVFLSLRINSGLDVGFLQKENKLGARLFRIIDEFTEKGWLKQQDGRLYLTEKGFLFADLIAGDLIFG